MARDLVSSACIALLGVVVSYRDTVSVRCCEEIGLRASRQLQ
jgi:hypothetical protein